MNVFYTANEERVKLNSEIRNLQRKQSPVQETVSVALDTQLGGGVPISNNTEGNYMYMYHCYAISRVHASMTVHVHVHQTWVQLQM